MITDKTTLLSRYGKEKADALENYLKTRFESVQKEKSLNVVYDLLHQCDICCLGCGTNAIMTSLPTVICEEMTLKQIEEVIKKIKKYCDKKNITPFVNYGGGEPFLRSDILQVLELTADVLGSNCIGIDTNASLQNSYEQICAALPYVSYIGISINGLESYHNWWSNNSRINAYANATSVIRRICQNKEYANKIEVTSVATKKNYKTLRNLMEYLKELGVKNYSVHRAIPVGRMLARADELVPDANEYLELLVDVVSASEKLSINAHVHHSIEAIYAALLFGINTYDNENVVNTNFRSSISIDPSGEVLIDPWCTTGFWKNLTLGNVHTPNFSFDAVFSGKFNDINKVRLAFDKTVRCHGCTRNCSGGSRIVAAVSEINRYGKDIGEIGQLVEALKAKDPACPLAYSEKGRV